MRKAMVRARTGDFVYSEAELDVMLEDISLFKQHGAQGVVFGVLTPCGDIDVAQTERLVVWVTSRMSNHQRFYIGSYLRRRLSKVKPYESIAKVQSLIRQESLLSQGV